MGTNTKQGAVHEEGGARQGGAGVLLTLSRAREALGLDYDEFDVAVQIGEVRTVSCGPRTWKVPPQEIARLRAEKGHPQPLIERVRLVSSAEAAKRLGIGRERFVRLAKAGYVRPVRWYVNRYRALVWMYLAPELPAFAEQSPALLRGPLPGGLREALERGEDERARGWRARRVAQLVRDAYDAWDEAAVWAALLGPEIVDDALPDPYERAHLRKLRAALPPGRTGAATPEQIRELTIAQHPDEIALGLVALADALGRARVLRPAAEPGSAPALSAGLRSPAPAPTACSGWAVGDRDRQQRLLPRDRQGPYAPAGSVPALPSPVGAGASRAGIALPVPAGRGGPGDPMPNMAPSAAHTMPSAADASGSAAVPDPQPLRDAGTLTPGAEDHPVLAGGGRGPRRGLLGLLVRGPRGRASGRAHTRRDQNPRRVDVAAQRQLSPRTDVPAQVQQSDRADVLAQVQRPTLEDVLAQAQHPSPADVLAELRQPARADARPQSSPTSVSRMTARPSWSDAARSTSAEMPQP